MDLFGGTARVDRASLRFHAMLRKTGIAAVANLALVLGCSAEPALPFVGAPVEDAPGVSDVSDVGPERDVDAIDDVAPETDVVRDVDPDVSVDAADTEADAAADIESDLLDVGSDGSVDTLRDAPLDGRDVAPEDAARDVDTTTDVDASEGDIALDVPVCRDAGRCEEVGSYCLDGLAIFCEVDESDCLVEVEVRCDLLGEVCAEFDDRAGCYLPCEGPAVCDAAYECVDGRARSCDESPLGCLLETEGERCGEADVCVVEPGRAFCQSMCGEAPECDPDDFPRACLDDRDLSSCQPHPSLECFAETVTDCGVTGATCVEDPTSRCDVLSCGDGAFDVGEECDDGNRLPGDGCNPSCEINDGWFCWLWPSECVASLCGDGVVSRGEGCDDRNADDLDGCSSECHLEVPPRTSDRPRIVGTLSATDVVYEAPTTACGDIGVAEFYGDFYWVTNPHAFEVDAEFELIGIGEDVDTVYLFADDFSPDSPTDSCLEANRAFHFGITSIYRVLRPGETVILGVSSSERFGTGSYTVTVSTGRCGDGRVDPVEECDDGDAEPGDGCSASCQVEPGYSCRLEGLGSVCEEPVCGDGSWGPPVEECDDGNTDPGDGCGADCTLEDGARCAFFETTECVLTVCGDGILDWGEGCEDGNLEDGDGCDALCRLEIPPAAGSLITEGRIEPGVDAEFRRPDGSCGGGFLLAYDALTLVNPSDEARAVQPVVGAGTSIYVATYSADFDPASPSLSCIDSVASLSPPLEMPPVTVGPGEEMVITIAPFRLDADAFDWSVEFRGVEIVP